MAAAPQMGPAVKAATCLIAMVAMSTAAVSHAETYALIVSGLGGEPQYDQRFKPQAGSPADAEERLPGPPARVISLIAPAATRDAIRQAIRTLAGKAGKGDR